MPPRGYSLRLTGKELVAALGVPQAARKGLFEAGSVLETTWKKKLKQPGSGTTYPADLTFITVGNRVIPVKREAVGMQNRTADHTASAPGEPPASDTGGLSASVGLRELPSEDKVRVGSGLKYAAYLERGVDDHPGGITIAPRPHARPSRDEAEPAMTERMRKALAEVGADVRGGLRSR